MAIIWRDQMSIDNGLIDNDHKCLIAIVNDLDVIHPGAGMPKQVTAILRRLNHYAQSHFMREEQLQAAVGYTLADAHHHRHRALTHELDAMRVEWEIVRAPRDMIAFHRRLGEFLHHWLVDHILKDDLLMQPFAAELRHHSVGMTPLGEVDAPRADVAAPVQGT